MLVTVNGLPYVDAGLDTNICDQLIGVNYVGNYVGGYWTGVGMDSSGLFMPFSVGTFDVYYHYTDGNGCYNEDTLGITVDATVYAYAGSDFEVCIDSGTISLGGIPVSGVWSGGSISPQGDYVTSVVDTLDFVFTYGSGNCLTRDTMELIVNPLPVVDAGIDFAVCVDDTIQVLIGNPLGGSWSGTGITNASGDFNPTIAGVGTHTLTYYYLDSNGCDKTDTRDVTVNGLPYVDAGLDTNICDQLIGVNYVGNYVGGYWTGVGMDSSGLFMPFSVGTFDVYYHYTDGNGCYNEDTLGITVDATVYAYAGSDFEVCIDSGTISLGGIPVSGVWSGGSISPQGDYVTSVVDTLDFVFTYGSGNCLTRDTMELIVNPLPVVDAGIDFAVCVDDTIQVLIGNPLGGSWSGTGITNASGDFNPTIAGVGTHTLTYYYLDSNGCDKTDTRDVTVNGLPYVDAGLDTNICDQLIGVNYVGNYVGGYWTGVGMDSSGLFMPFSVGTFDVYYHYTDGNGCYNEDTLGITVDATVYAYAGSDFEVCIDSGTISLGGIPVSGVWSGGSISPQGDYVTSVVDTLDFVFTYGSGNCLTRDTMELIVNPLPVVDAGIDFAVCVDDTIQVLIGNPLGGSWSGTGITNASGDFNPTIAGVGTHTLTYYYLDSNGCDKTDTRDVTVNGLPYVDAGLDTNICDQLIGVNYVGNYVGGYWTGVGMDSSGLFMPFSVGTFDVYYHYTDGNGCYNEDTLGITVDATVYAYAGSDFEVCIDSGTISLGGIPVSGVWSGGSISPQGDYVTSVVDTLDFVFTYGSGNCLTRDTMELIVNPLPVVDAGIDFAVCVDDTIQVLIGNPLGGSWSGTGITNASGDFNPTIAGVGTHTLTYYYLDSNGCDKTDTRDVTVNGLPYVDAGLDTNICDQLIGVNYVGNYVGGYWTGVGMDSSGLFMPFSVGTFDVYYHYTDGNGCYNEDTLGITVDATVYAYAGSDFEVCIDSGTISLGGIPVSGVWSGGSISPQGDYVTSVVDTLDFVFTYGSGNCLTRDTMELIVNPLPVVDAGIDFAVCVDDTIQVLIGNPLGGSWSGTGITNASGDLILR